MLKGMIYDNRTHIDRCANSHFWLSSFYFGLSFFHSIVFGLVWFWLSCALPTQAHISIFLKAFFNLKMHKRTPWKSIFVALPLLQVYWFFFLDFLLSMFWLSLRLESHDWWKNFQEIITISFKDGVWVRKDELYSNANWNWSWNALKVVVSFQKLLLIASNYGLFQSRKICVQRMQLQKNNNIWKTPLKLSVGSIKRSSCAMKMKFIRRKFNQNCREAASYFLDIECTLH